ASQCHISVPVSAAYQCCQSVTYQYQSVPPISASQCCLTVPVSVAYQFQSVLAISATYQCHQCPLISAHQCCPSVPITAASIVHISEGEKSLIYKIL
ncbi:unnamed protein product, partial [Staurois parvus]